MLHSEAPPLPLLLPLPLPVGVEHDHAGNGVAGDAPAQLVDLSGETQAVQARTGDGAQSPAGTSTAAIALDRRPCQGTSDVQIGRQRTTRMRVVTKRQERVAYSAWRSEAATSAVTSAGTSNAAAAVAGAEGEVG